MLPYSSSSLLSPRPPPTDDQQRRRLPPTPDDHRRCSSPRILPQSPVSPDIRPSSALWTTDNGSRSPVVRKSSGRQLPRAPDQQPASLRASPLSSPAPLSPNETTHFEVPPALVQQQPYHHDSPLKQTNDKLNSDDTTNHDPIPAPPLNRTPSPAFQRQLIRTTNNISTSPRRDSSVDSQSSASLRYGVIAPPPPSTPQHQQRNSTSTIVGRSSSSTFIVESPRSSLSPSIEKSSSDAETDPLVLGIDPKLYRQTSQSSNSVPDFANSAADGAAAVSNSNSWGPESEPRPTGLGLLHYSLQHFPVRRRLRVSIFKAEGLAGQLRPELELHAFCKVMIMPGKQGKQRSSIVKRSRDAVFNQEFFFDNIGADEIAIKSIAIRVCHHSGRQLQKDVVIGDIQVPLKDIHELNTKKEVRLVEELKPLINVKKLGKLYISTCLEKDARRLTINLVKADDLPKWGISGPPDVCIRITLTQAGATQTKQSRVLKNTCSAKYSEAVMFLISTKSADIDDIRITLSVHDLARTASGDDLIGSAFLGKLAVDRSEADQWRQTVANPGKEFKACHHLKLPAPVLQVHVGETLQSDSDG